MNCGFELELTQKSASRVVAKFNKYIEDKYFHRVIYLFEFERDYRKYISIFTDVISRLQNQEDSKRIITKFLFAYSNDLENDSALIKKTVVNFNFEELTFEKLLHDERIPYSYVNQTKH